MAFATRFGSPVKRWPGGGDDGLGDYSGSGSQLFSSHVMLPSNMNELLLRENSFEE